MANDNPGLCQIDPIRNIPQAHESAVPGDSHLFRLPLELRDLIYEYSIVEDKPIYIKATDSQNPRQFSEQVQQPALTRICRQIRQEALPIFYKKSIFRIDVPKVSEYRALPFMLFPPPGQALGSESSKKWVTNTFASLRCWLDKIGESKSKLVQRLECTSDIEDKATAGMLKFVFAEVDKHNDFVNMRRLLGWYLKEGGERVEDAERKTRCGKCFCFAKRPVWELQRV